MRRALALLAACACAAAAAGTARATNECRGLQVCVPVAGPWVVASSPAQVQFLLACPRGFIVAGLDAELSRRGVDVSFEGALGSPVNPGVTTSTSALFFGRLLAGGAAATFRPHVGCIPASGAGQRYPTAYRPVPPSRPLAPTAVQLTVVPGVHRFVERCARGQHLVAATHAVGFFTDAPPPAGAVRGVRVVQAVHGGAVRLVVRAGRLPGVSAVVQVDLLCAPGR